MADTTAPFDIEEQRVRINRSIAETEKFVAEQHKLLAEAYKMNDEGLKLAAEARKLGRDAVFAPWQLAFTGFGAGAAVVGAFAGIVKLLGH